MERIRLLESELKINQGKLHHAADQAEHNTLMIQRFNLKDMLLEAYRKALDERQRGISERLSG